jgi:hypothetical protein
MKRMLAKSVHLTCLEDEDVAVVYCAVRGQPAALLKFRAREMGRFVRLVVFIQARRCPSLSDRAPIQRRGITGKVWCNSDDFTEFPIHAVQRVGSWHKKSFDRYELRSGCGSSHVQYGTQMHVWAKSRRRCFQYYSPRCGQYKSRILYDKQKENVKRNTFECANLSAGYYGRDVNNLGISLFNVTGEENS